MLKPKSTDGQQHHWADRFASGPWDDGRSDSPFKGTRNVFSFGVAAASSCVGVETGDGCRKRSVRDLVVSLEGILYLRLRAEIENKVKPMECLITVLILNKHCRVINNVQSFDLHLQRRELGFGVLE